MMRKRHLLTAVSAIAAISFSQIALSQIDIRGRGVTGDVNQSTTTQGAGSESTTQQGSGSPSTTQQQGTGNQATTQSGTGNQAQTQSGTNNQATEQSGTSNQSTSQMGKDNQSTTQMGSSNQSTTQQGSGDQTAQQTQTPSGAGPTSDPNVTRDAQGREHENKGKHKGWANKEDRSSQSSRAEDTGSRKY
jgi:large repetitive protein